MLDSAEMGCILKVLKILKKGKNKYSAMFKETKFSHDTLQKVLKDLEKKKFIKRQESEYKIVDYEITEKGKRLLEKLDELGEILK